jgi:hypothetical protein
MNIAELQRRLLAAARQVPPDPTVPYAFERRIMAHLPAASAADPCALWSRVLWRAAAPCVGLVLVLSAWSFLASRDTGSPETLAADLERTLYAAFDPLEDVW